MAAGRSIWAALEFLDRQIIDVDDVPTAKVDDLEFTFSPEPGSLPILTGILCGPAALARRFGGRLGRTVETLHRLLAVDDAAQPASISMGVVSRIDRTVHLTVSRSDVPVNDVEAWLGEHLIGHIPGSEAGGARGPDDETD
jgi:hypothetical protein